MFKTLVKGYITAPIRVQSNDFEHGAQRKIPSNGHGLQEVVEPVRLLLSECRYLI